MARQRVIMHVDMDAFYASVEQVRQPELTGRPFYVGGAERGVVLSANHVARQYGIAGGMPSSRARRLCPQAVAVPPDFDRYAQVSRGVFAIFASYTSQIEAISIDEAFLDITGALRRLGSPRLIGEQVRAQVADEQQVNCSVGLGPSKFVAKLASTQAKPDGLLAVQPDEVISFLHPLPVGAIWGVGEVTEEKLHRLGLKTISDLAHTSRLTLQRALGVQQGSNLFDLAWGLDRRRVKAVDTEHSIGSQETFSHDTDDPEVVYTELLRVTARTALRMRQAGVLGQAVTVSVRFANFVTISRTGRLPGPTDVTDDIHAQAVRIYAGMRLGRARIRRVGVRVEGLIDVRQAYQQPTLDAPDKGMRQVEVVADEAVIRFGPAAVRRARLTGRSRKSNEMKSAEYSRGLAGYS